MSGKLYIVGTPIGNLGDFSPRAVETLRAVDFIAAEDTRVSRKLLTHFDIPTKMVSYHQHNSKQRGDEIVRLLEAGESCALITDAGMPSISDPGENLVSLAHKHMIPVETVPGPTALTTALALSGMNSRKFIFEGFLEGKVSEKKTQLIELKGNTRTIIYYESPHRLAETLLLMLDIFGNRKIAICRELTKYYEEILFFELEKVAEYYSQNEPRGEFVLIVEGALQTTEARVSLETAVEMVLLRQQQGTSLSTAAKEVAEMSGYRKSALYKKALERSIPSAQ